jgi:PAS domain S-box-containing protein
MDGSVEPGAHDWPDIDPGAAEAVLTELADVFFRQSLPHLGGVHPSGIQEEQPVANLEARYRTLVEQIPAVVFMAYLDRGISEAYVSPRIEEALGFTQEEWLEDPVRWFYQVHPDDRQRWSLEAARMFLTGQPLRSSYRVLARDGSVVWFHCEAKMVREESGRPWFIHGVGFDITELKTSEAALQGERNLMSAILDTVGAIVAVLDPDCRIMRINRACERISGFTSAEARGRFVWDLFVAPEEARRMRTMVERLQGTDAPRAFESSWLTRDGEQRHIAWSSIVLGGTTPARAFIVTTGIDITERKRMEKTVLEISAREQRQIGQDLHDGLGQHLTGIAFMSKVLQQKLEAKGLEEAASARKIVGLVNEAIHRTRELSRGLLPVVTDEDGLMTTLERWTREVHDLFDVPCEFVCPQPVLIGDVGTATQLYYIAHEAVHNAIKHASPDRIVLTLRVAHGSGSLTIEDDGAGIVDGTSDGTGLGLHIMRHRASMIGGSLDIRPGKSGGTVVHCGFPAKD